MHRLLGVRWWGEGAFVREQKLGRQLRGQVFRVSAGNLIYNRLFAFRGSFASVSPELDGCFASGEFPTFRVRPDVKGSELLFRYIARVLNSPQTLAVVDRESTGSTKTSLSEGSFKFSHRDLALCEGCLTVHSDRVTFTLHEFG